MPASPEQFRFSFSFTKPVERITQIAQRFQESPNEQRRATAKAVLDVTREGLAVFVGIQKPGTVDVAPYFDMWLGDAIDAANELLLSDDKDDRDLAKCLLDQEQDIIKSKEIFLVELKRWQSGRRDNHDT